MKICSECGIAKRKKEFHRCKSKRDGLHHKCKQCVSDYKKKSGVKNPVKLLKLKRKMNKSKK